MDTTNCFLSFSSYVFKLSLKLHTYKHKCHMQTHATRPSVVKSENKKKNKYILFFSGSSHNMDLYGKIGRKSLSQMVNIKIQYFQD